MAHKDKALMDAVDPFRRVLALNDPLRPPDDMPLHSILPGVWPTVGELRVLVDLATKAATP